LGKKISGGSSLLIEGDGNSIEANSGAFRKRLTSLLLSKKKTHQEVWRGGTSAVERRGKKKKKKKKKREV